MKLLAFAKVFKNGAKLVKTDQNSGIMRTENA